MSDLGLEFQAARHLDFLVSESGYRCTASTPYAVRFESQTTFIEVLFDGNRSYELDLVIGNIDSIATRSPAFSIAEILRFKHATEAEKYALVQVTSSEALASFVEQLCLMLRKYGGDFVAGNEKSFEELSLQRQKESQAYALERDLRIARTAAEAAWRKKDYATMVKVLLPLCSNLTASEMGKLRFAEKQCSQ